MSVDNELRWEPCTKDPGETLPVELSVFGLVAQYWEPNEKYVAGDFVWPSTANGYVYECTQSGRSSAKEPKWNLVAGQAMAKLDGSAQWTCRVPDSQGLSVLENPIATPPDGITVPSCYLNEGTKLFVDYAGGEDGQDYEVRFDFVIGSRPRVGRQLVQVRKK